MAQHKAITKARVSDMLVRVEHSGRYVVLYGDEPLILLLPEIDAFLVKHDRTDMARRLRKAFDTIEERV